MPTYVFDDAQGNSLFNDGDFSQAKSELDVAVAYNWKVITVAVAQGAVLANRHLLGRWFQRFRYNSLRSDGSFSVQFLVLNRYITCTSNPLVFRARGVIGVCVQAMFCVKIKQDRFVRTIFSLVFGIIPAQCRRFVCL